MAEAPFPLTDLDAEILARIYPTGAITIMGVDPRVSVRTMARSIGTSRSRVAARVRLWERSGLLQGYDVWPNPFLFGLIGGSADLRVRGPLDKRALLGRLSLVDGAAMALEFVGEWVSVQILGPDRATLERRLRLIGGFAEVVEVGGFVEWPPLDPGRPLSPLDLRIVRALRRRPTATLSETAKEVGISARTMTVRYQRLLDDHAVWFIPRYDMTRLTSPVVGLNLELRDPSERARVVRSLRSRLPRFLEFAWRGAPPPGREGALSLVVLGGSPAAMDDLLRIASSVDGVVGTEASSMVRIVTFPHTIDALVAARPPSGPTGGDRAR